MALFPLWTVRGGVITFGKDLQKMSVLKMPRSTNNGFQGNEIQPYGRLPYFDFGLIEETYVTFG